MKRSLKTFGVLLASLFVMPFAVDAATISYDDIPNGSYVIGKHIFTRESGSLTVKKIMLASRTIESEDLDDMQIIYKDIMGNLKEVSAGKDEDTNQYPDADIELTDVVEYDYYDMNPDLSNVITLKGNALTSTYYNKYENQTYRETDSEFDTDLFYTEVGKYTGESASEVESVTINGKEYTNEVKRMGIGQNSWLEAPVWKIEENKVYVATAWLIAESMPGTQTEIVVGETTLNLGVLPEDVSENTLAITEVYKLNVLDNQTFNLVREGNTIAIESSYGNHIVGVTLNLDGEDLLNSNDVIYSLADNGTLSLTTPESVEKKFGDASDLQKVTYAIYPAFKNGEYVDQEDKTVLHKIAIPGKGVIRLNFALTAVNHTE